MNTITRKSLAFIAIAVLSASAFATSLPVEPVQAPVRVTETKGVNPADVAISDEVSMKILKDERFNDWNVAISTKNGVVTLAGTAPNADGIKVVTEVAKAVTGVKSVDNKMTVGKLPAQAVTIKVITGAEEDAARKAGTMK